MMCRWSTLAWLAVTRGRLLCCFAAQSYVSCMYLFSLFSDRAVRKHRLLYMPMSSIERLYALLVKAQLVSQNQYTLRCCPGKRNIR